MRMIGQLPEKLSAQRLVDVLAAADIEAVAETGKQGWTVWVRDEDRVADARRLREQFLSAPNSPEMLKAESEGRRRRNRLEQERETASKQQAVQTVVMRERWRRPSSRQAPFTSLLIIVCIGVSIFTNFGQTEGMFESPTSVGEELLNSLLVVDAPAYVKQQMDAGVPPGDIDMDALEFRTWNLRQGQIWRLWTPCLVHFGVAHIVFNMFMLFRLGTILEQVLGTPRYVLFVLTSGIAANIGCFVPDEGTGLLSNGGWLAGGMSGVLYALFGLALLRDRLTGRFPLIIPPSTAFLLLMWLALGFTGALDDPERGVRISNWAHGSGFAFGVAVGYVAYASRGKQGPPAKK
ncbi:MAG: rhomboid family intramembrane serine protease [Planctomycetales bacterium]|nr:rhomboid family intramembrane serine protease [Planctomycetales bacterium]